MARKGERLLGSDISTSEQLSAAITKGIEAIKASEPLGILRRLMGGRLPSESETKNTPRQELSTLEFDSEFTGGVSDVIGQELILTEDVITAADILRQRGEPRVGTSARVLEERLDKLLVKYKSGQIPADALDFALEGLEGSAARAARDSEESEIDTSGSD